MKPHVGALVALSIAALSGCGNGSSANSKLLGTWSGTDALGQKMSLIFSEGSPMKLRIVLGSAGGSREMTGTCSIDLGQDPGHFDIQLQDRGEIQTILSLIDSKTIKFQNIGSSTPRPSAFNDEAVTLKRQ